MWEYNYTDELYHYGVPGMKWGVRKDSRAYKTAARRTKKIGRRLEKRAKQGAKLVENVAVKPTVKVAKRTVKVGKFVGKTTAKTTVKAAKRTVKVGKFVGKTVVVKPTVKAAKRTAKVASWFANGANAILNSTVGAASTVASAFRGKKAVEKMNDKES